VAAFVTSLQKKKLSFGNKNNKMALFSHFLAKDVTM
jgi:hypothetical protein